jgi:hypothetical protein
MIKNINGQNDTHIHLIIKTWREPHYLRMMFANTCPISDALCNEDYNDDITPIQNHTAIAKQLADKLNWEIQSCQSCDEYGSIYWRCDDETEDGMVWLCLSKEEVNL